MLTIVVDVGGLLLTLVVVADIEGYRGHDHGNNTCCQQRRAMSIATRAVNDYRRCQPQCDVAATMRDLVVAAIAHCCCHVALLLASPVVVDSNNATWQQQCAIAATT